MKNKILPILLILLGIAIVAIIALDFVSKQPGKRGNNPFELNVDDLKEVDPALILYKEVRELNLKMEKQLGMDCFNDILYVIGDHQLLVLETSGKLLLDVSLPVFPTAVAANGENMVVASENSVLILDNVGNLLSEWKDFPENSYLTALAIYDGKIFISDAGQRKVYRYNMQGEKELEITGKKSAQEQHGFIVPSGYFDLAINEYGELWIVNPGKHTLENYTLDGELRGFWSAQTPGVEGFTGCCNPAYFTFLPGGNFVTSEKAILRIKEYKPSGEFTGVVAPPTKFGENDIVCDIAADSKGLIYVGDTNKNSIRVFERIDN